MGIWSATSRVLAACAAGLAMAWCTLCEAQPTNAATPSAPAENAQPVIGPPPPWVTPIAFATDAPRDDAPVRFLLQDQQVYLEAGRQTVYTETALRIQTPAGLAVGNISLPWRPDSSVLTVHKLQILRGREVIDVLASGQAFTVLRREQNLEIAILDGVLTANIQPEGLQVDDILVIAASVSSSDPVLGDHVEAVGAGWNLTPVSRAHLSVQWPEGLNVEHRLTAALPSVRLVRRGGNVRFDLSLDNLEPLPLPNGAPARFAIPRMASFTSFRSWADLAALMAPLYQRGATLPAESRVAAEAARIREQTADPVARAEAALALVQGRVRYVALAMGDGGFVPADAETTWSRRYGDCKGKTVLLLALLRALDIEAEAVLVSTVMGDGLDQRLPMVAFFDHVLVRATIAGRAYWLDGTRIGDTRLAGVQTPNFGWGLPLVPRGASLVRMLPAPLEEPNQISTVRIDASAGIAAPAPIRVDYVLRGDEAVQANMYYASLGAEARDNMLREYWRRQYDDLEITSVETRFDPQAREQRYVMEGRVRMDWGRGRYAPAGVEVGYRADFTRDPGPDRDAPFAMPYPYFTQVVQTVVLPEGQGAFQVTGGDFVDQTVAGISYRRRAEITGNTFRVELSERSVAPEFSAAEAPAAQAALRALADRVINIVRPTQNQTPAANVAVTRSPTDPLPGYGAYRFGMTAEEARAADANLRQTGPQFGASTMLTSDTARTFGSIGLRPMLMLPNGALGLIRYMGEARVRSADECTLIFTLVVGVLESEIGPLDGPPAENEYGAPLPVQAIGASRIRFYASPGAPDQRRGHANRRGAHPVEATAGAVPSADGMTCRVSIEFRDQPLLEPVAGFAGVEPPSAEQLAAARVIEEPNWIERPESSRLGRILPINYNNQPVANIRVELDCLVMEGGRVNCRVASEDPAGLHYGDAAVRWSRGHRIASEQNGQRTLGARVRIPLTIDFRFPGFVAPSQQPQQDMTALRALAASAPTTAELDAAPLIERANWVTRPDGPAFARHYPVDALQRGLSGSVTLTCLVLDDGHLRCAVTSEDPADAQFGLAALGIAQSFQMARDIDGQPTAGRRVVVPIRFRIG